MTDDPGHFSFVYPPVRCRWCSAFTFACHRHCRRCGRRNVQYDNLGSENREDCQAGHPKFAAAAKVHKGVLEPFCDNCGGYFGPETIRDCFARAVTLNPYRKPKGRTA